MGRRRRSGAFFLPRRWPRSPVRRDARDDEVEAEIRCVDVRASLADRRTKCAPAW